MRGKDLDYAAYARATEGYSGSDIKLVCKEAAMRPLRRILRKLQDIEDSDGSTRDENSVLKGESKGPPCNDVLRETHRLNQWRRATVNMDPVCPRDVEASLECVNASGGTFKKRYEKWDEQFGSGSKSVSE